MVNYGGEPADGRTSLPAGELPDGLVATAAVKLAEAQRAAVLALRDHVANYDTHDPLNEEALLAITAPQYPVQHLLVTDDASQLLVAYAQDLAGVEQRQRHLMVAPAHRRRGIGRALVATQLRQSPSASALWWAHGDLPAARQLAGAMQLRAVRHVQLWTRDLAETGVGGPSEGTGVSDSSGSCATHDSSSSHETTSQPLPDPAVPPDVTITPLDASQQAAWLELNNQAFADHPEQGNWTASDLHARQSQPWFDPEGLLVARDGESLLGTIWLKTFGAQGEIYVLATSAAARGRGIGAALLATGLRYLRRRGCRTAELHVDAANAAALRLYRRAGFTHHSQSTAYAPE